MHTDKKKINTDTNRVYRQWVESNDLLSFEVIEEESDLLILAERDLVKEARDLIKRIRSVIQEYIRANPEFERSLQPIAIDNSAPPIIQEMQKSAQLAGVGPMAAVAGAVAEYVGKGLLKFSSQILVENGGDIFIKGRVSRIIGIYAGSSPLSGKVNLRIPAENTPLGICTSSGTVGHSLSFGRADSVTILSQSTALADAAATAVANIVKVPADIDKGIELAKTIEGVKGVLVIVGKELGVWGEIELAHG